MDRDIVTQIFLDEAKREAAEKMRNACYDATFSLGVAYEAKGQLHSRDACGAAASGIADLDIDEVLGIKEGE